MEQQELKIEESFYPDGQIKRRAYFLYATFISCSKKPEYFGKLHRLNGPAVQEWFPDGKMSAEFHYINGNFHNETGPAWKEFHENGQLHIQKHFINGYCHNAIGPAYQEWDEKGQLIEERFFFNFKMFSSLEELLYFVRYSSLF